MPSATNFLMKDDPERTKLVEALYQDEPCLEDTTNPNSERIDAVEKMVQARLRLLYRFPFFGKIALSMPTVENNTVPTTAVDRRGRLYYNVKWVNGHNVDQMMFEMGHEVMHIVQRCFDRAPENVMHGTWNLAADFYCDSYLVEAKIPQSPISLMMCPPNVQKLAWDLGSIEAMYEHLLKEMKDNTDCPACKAMADKALGLEEDQNEQDKKDNQELNKEEDDGDSEDDSSDSDGSGSGDSNSESDSSEHSHGDSDEACDHGDESGNDSGSGSGNEPKHTCGNVRSCCTGVSADVSDKPVEEQKWREKIIAAKEYADAKGQGNLPGALGELIADLTKSKVRWQDHLRRSATLVFGRGRYTFKRPNRRGYASGLRLPSRQPEHKCAAVFIDSSGSVSDDELRQTLTEAVQIMDECGAPKVLVGIADTNVTHFAEVSKDQMTDLQFPRGGTSHIEVFEVLNGQSEEWPLPSGYTMEMVVCFTDMGTTFPSEIPKFDVLWGVFDPSAYGYIEAPFGKEVKVPVVRVGE